MKKSAPTEFEQVAARSRSNVFSDVLGWLKSSKKWWLLPILITLLVLGFLILLSGSGLAPFIYTLF